MKHFVISLFVRTAQKEHPRWYRFLTLLATIILVFIVLPCLYLYTGRYIEPLITAFVAKTITQSIAFISLTLGGGLIVWALILQYGYGEGSGSHVVPTKHLIVSGPYKLSRHPMLVGAVFFYLGTGTLLSSLTVGIYGALITAILAYYFALYIEEPVLVIRFGEQYEKYQQEVPIIPFSFTRVYYRNRKHKSND
jgi:protein-S-isoprenylcysteine O-methyltransferase Ste14